MKSKNIEILEIFFQRLADYPDEALRDLMQAMDDIEKKHGLLYRMTDEERAAVDEGHAQAKRGEFVSDEEMEAFWKRHWP